LHSLKNAKSSWYEVSKQSVGPGRAWISEDKWDGLEIDVLGMKYSVKMDHAE